MLRAIKNQFWVQANVSPKKLTNIIGHNGQPLFIDTDFNKFGHAENVATVYSKPMSIETDHNGVNLYDTEINIGDTVIVHHHVCQKKKEIMDGNNKVYRCDYFNLIAKIENNEIIPLEQFFFVQPIKEEIKKSSFGFDLSTHATITQGSGYVYILSKQAKESGLCKGDKVYYTNNANYSMTILGVKLYRMRIRNIIAIERNGELYCMNNKVLIKETPKQQGRFIIADKGQERDGVIKFVGAETKGIKVNDNVNFCYGVSERVYWQNDTYGAIETKHINYIQ